MQKVKTKKSSSDILMINTAIKSFFVASCVDGILKCEFFDYMEQAEKIADITKNLIKDFTAEKKILVINVGPGSLTGTRIGCAFASGLSIVFDEIYAINSFMLFLNDAKNGKFEYLAISGKKNSLYVCEVNQVYKDAHDVSFKEINTVDLDNSTYLATDFNPNKMLEFFNSQKEMQSVKQIQPVYPSL